MQRQVQRHELNIPHSSTPLPYLIIGQGLAGSALAWRLIKAGQSCLVIDRALSDTASRVAAGLVNPLLGRKIKPDWRQAECLEAAHRYYRETEQELGGSWWQCGEIWRELDDEEQIACWQSRQNEAESAYFAGPLLPWYGDWKGMGRAAITRGAAVLHAELLVNAQRQWLIEQNSFLEAEVKASDIQNQPDGSIRYQGKSYQAVIWCTGFELPKALELPYLESRLSQGCILDLQLPEFDQAKVVLHFGHWLVKHGDIWRLGASYDWAWSDPCVPSPTAPSELMHEFTKRYDGDWTIVRMRAAVRPIIRHSQPVAGAIPERAGHYMLSGLGSRGCTTAPWVSEQLAQHLLKGSELPQDLSPAPMHLKYMRRIGAIKC